MTVDFVHIFNPDLVITGAYHHCAADALVVMEKAMKRDQIDVNDRQLACAHINSVEGQDYLKSMASAANYAWVNRSSMTFLARQVSVPPSGCWCRSVSHPVGVGVGQCPTQWLFVVGQCPTQ